MLIMYQLIGIVNQLPLLFSVLALVGVGVPNEMLGWIHYGGGNRTLFNELMGSLGLNRY